MQDTAIINIQEADKTRLELIMAFQDFVANSATFNKESLKRARNALRKVNKLSKNYKENTIIFKKMKATEVNLLSKQYKQQKTTL
jgi:hypothetical protein